MLFSGDVVDTGVQRVNKNVVCDTNILSPACKKCGKQHPTHTCSPLYSIKNRVSSQNTCFSIACCPKHLTQKERKGTICDVFWSVASIIGYLADLGSDIYLAYSYYSNAHYEWFGLTLAFILIPSLVMNVFSFVLYVDDHRSHNTDGKQSLLLTWSMKVALTCLQLAVLYR